MAVQSVVVPGNTLIILVAASAIKLSVAPTRQRFLLRKTLRLNILTANVASGGGAMNWAGVDLSGEVNRANSCHLMWDYLIYLDFFVVVAIQAINISPPVEGSLVVLLSELDAACADPLTVGPASEAEYTSSNVHKNNMLTRVFEHKYGNTLPDTDTSNIQEQEKRNKT